MSSESIDQVEARWSYEVTSQEDPLQDAARSHLESLQLGNKIAVEFAPEKGRHFVAKSALQPGTNCSTVKFSSCSDIDLTVWFVKVTLFSRKKPSQLFWITSLLLVIVPSVTTKYVSRTIRSCQPLPYLIKTLITFCANSFLLPL